MSTRNRLGNSHNMYQNDNPRTLVCCSAGLLRSPTCAWVLSNNPWNHNTRAAGLNDEYALVLVDQVLLEWADSVVVMDNRQEKMVLDMMEQYGYNKKVYNLNVPDNYGFRDPELVELLTEKLLEVFPVSDH